MNRRHFLQSSAIGTAALGAAGAEPPVRKLRLKTGHQQHSSDADLRVLAALGVNHICSALPSRTLDNRWSV